MIPSNVIAHAYVGIFGGNTLLSMAQSNLLSNLDRIRKVRTHTYLSNNGQTRQGVSHNFGAERCYSWKDTVIDCRNSPSVVDSPVLEDFEDSIAETPRFRTFKKAVEERSNGKLSVRPFYTIVKGEENMRYNILCDNKIEDFDIIRVGVEVFAASEEAFSQGLKALQDWEKPFRVVGMPLSE